MKARARDSIHANVRANVGDVGRASIVVVAIAFGCGDDGAAPAGDSTGGDATSLGESTAPGESDDSSGVVDTTCADGECGSTTGAACSNGATGSLHDQVLALGDGVEDRFYFLHVPAGYDCETPAPLLVDFHGTAGGLQPEEAYQNDALVALAEAKNAIVVRPRSRSSERGGEQIFRWDQNAGDLARNVLFTQNLVASLQTQYNIDASRVYASGFSSGSNMTTRFLAEDARGLFRGLAPIAGGIFDEWPGRDLEIAPFADGEAPRLFLATGYRDYLWDTQQALVDALAAANVPDDDVLRIEYDVGHDLYPWHFAELWAFLDEGARPPSMRPMAPWAEESLPDSTSVLELAARSDGTIVATGVGGNVWQRDADGTWSLAATIDGISAPTGLCIDGSDRAYVAGVHGFAASTPSLEFAAAHGVPQFFDQVFADSSYLTSVGCSGASPLVAGGYWNAAHSEDLGAHWNALDVDVGGYKAQLAAAHVTSTGTIVAVGYYSYIGRGDPGATSLVAVDHPFGSDWLTGIASAGNEVWVVGDYGKVLHSDDDGATWTEQPSPTDEDLYAVAFADASTGIAVGRRGTVIATHDGGTSWDAIPTGVDEFFGAAAFVGPDEVLVGGTRVLHATIQ